VARTDHEGVLRDLSAWIATEKPGYGRQELLEKVAVLSAAHVVPESLLERALRIFGVHHVLTNIPETGPTGGGGSAAPDKGFDPGPTMSQEVHHGARNGHAAAGAGPR
jgi:hypothetical protein